MGSKGKFLRHLFSRRDKSRGETRPSRQDSGLLPRLPHERDESIGETPTTEVIQIAAADVASGRVDTDARGQQAADAFEAAFGSPSDSPNAATKGST